ncbi:MAG: hypothetical protein CSYNP_01833 [Syntrophus sp. SKADARSKE-3]|nr:hypothetical protein [Syntrophus sp. SKADARSKE-3]
MLSFLYAFSKPPSLRQVPLKPYVTVFPLDRLNLGVDNIHIDVHISPQVQNTVRKAAALLLVKHSHSEGLFPGYDKEQCEKEKKILRHLCTELLLDVLDQAKLAGEVQIDYLGHAAVAKTFLVEINSEYEKLVAVFENLIRTYELSYKREQLESLKVKEQRTELGRNRKRIIHLVGEELYAILADIHLQTLRNIRETNFPSGSLLPDNFYFNPLVPADMAVSDAFMIETYILLGHRSDDPDNSDNLTMLINNLLANTDMATDITNDEDTEGRESTSARAEGLAPLSAGTFDPWIREPSNMEQLFDCFSSREAQRRAIVDGAPSSVLLELKKRIDIQERLLHFFYRSFRKKGLIRYITANYEMKSLYRRFCPPLVPLQVREFLARPASRKSIVQQLKRRNAFSKPAFSLAPLVEAARRIRSGSVREKKRMLLCFFLDYSRYLRDQHDWRLIKEAMEAINLAKDEKLLVLSRENRSLYEFLLPGERTTEEKPILNHTILKADIRGSMGITYTMRAKGLNPASHFSLNFFDPISEILFEYGGSKVFIEGDAVILSIVEHEETPRDWYCVARACGLAIRILKIVERYNGESRKNQLPVLEVGIGICYNQGPPAFLFDGDSRITISPAINLADRLSGCDKRLRKHFRDENRVFNVLVFENVRKEEVEVTADDLSLRYNVNGIELDSGGFAKLEKEINLKRVLFPTDNGEKTVLYTGKVPTLTGKYQLLAIREGIVSKIHPETMEVIGETSRKYYEVCTHPAIYKFLG